MDVPACLYGNDCLIIGKGDKIYSQINFIYLFLIFSLLPLTLFIRSRNQSILLNSIGINLSIKENYHLFLTGLSMSITPIGFGQVIKSHFLENKYDHPISKTLPLVFVERLLDFIAIICLLWISLIFYFSSDTLIILSISTAVLFSLFLLLRFKKFMVKIQTIVKSNSFLWKIQEISKICKNIKSHSFSLKIREISRIGKNSKK